jgi:hypothetical protein
MSPASSRASLLALALLAGCATKTSMPAHSASSSKAAPPVAPQPLRTEDLLGQLADVEVTLKPSAIVRDKVYGPLLRRASALATAYVGPPTLGTTAMAALERTDRVDAAVSDAGDAVVILRGVPADLDVTQIVDEKGRPIWRPVQGDVRQSVIEYEPAEPSDAALFVLPARTWLVASGTARVRARERLALAAGGVAFDPTEAPLGVLSIRGASLLRREGRLRAGPISPLGSSLLRAAFELTSGAEGVVVARLEYSDASAASGAELTARDIVAAFRHRLEEAQKGTLKGAPPPLAWLGAAGVDRGDKVVTIRAPIPRSWLEAVAHADLAGATPGDVPWALWRRSLPAPTLSLPGAQSRDEPQEPSQPPLTQGSP